MTEISRRLLQGLVSVFLLLSAVFFLIRLIPGDPALLLAGPTAPPEVVDAIRQKLGFDQPVLIQYVNFLGRMFTGDFGISVISQRGVVAEIMQRLPNTAGLALTGMVVAVALGLVTGTIAAIRQNTALDLGLTAIAVMVISIPSFWLGLVLVNFFAVQLRWLPAFGMGSWRNYILPSIVIAATHVGLIMRVTRGTMIDALASEYVRTAKAKGASQSHIVVKHAFRNALVPIITVICLQFGVLFSGAVVTETVFNWPGLGRLMVQSVQGRDYPVIQALIIVFGVIFIFINLIADVLNSIADPRLRTGR